MITAKEAEKLYQESKKLINEEALESVEKGIITACKRGENFAEFQKIPEPVIALLRTNGYSVVIANVVIHIDGISKSVSGFKVYW